MESSHPETKLTLIRHAESLLNIASHNYRVEHDLPYVWSELCKRKTFLRDVKYNPEFIDCKITDQGVKQCMKAREAVKDIKPDLILVSPLLRTLQTCSLIFQDFQDIPVKVQPLLAEAFRSSCDISSSLDKKMSEFSKYDFGPTLSEGEFWFIKNDSTENQEKYFDMLEGHKQKSYDQKVKAVLDYMAETMIYEHPISMRARTKRIKEMIKEKYSQKYRHIVIVAHYNTINFLVCRHFSEQNEPSEHSGVENCQIVDDTFEEILKYN